MKLPCLNFPKSSVATGGIEIIKAFRAVDYCVFTHLPPIIVDKDIAHNRQNPPLEVGIVNEFVFVVKRFQACILHQIMSLLLIGGQLQCKSHEIPLHSYYRGLEGIALVH